jgi:hypothetical protein
VANELRRLFEQVATMPFDARAKLRPMPHGERIEGTAFFPGGTGLWGAPQNRRFPVGGVMILGNTFDSLEGFRRMLQAGAEIKVNGPTSWVARAGHTWDRLARLLIDAGIDPRRCWCTNAYPGLIEQRKGNLGSAGVRRGTALHAWCEAFFLRSVRLMKPSLVLALGAEPIRFMGPLLQVDSWTEGVIGRIDEIGDAVRKASLAGADVTAMALVHPCLRTANLGRRRLPPRRGRDPEVELLRRLSRRTPSVLLPPEDRPMRPTSQRRLSVSN